MANLAEERGRGIDLLIRASEVRGTPPPEFQAEDDFFRVTLLAARPYQRLTKEERIRAVYFHVALAKVSDRIATNSTLRERFGLAESNSNSVAMSRLLKEAAERGWIRVSDGDSGPRSRSYVPCWA